MPRPDPRGRRPTHPPGSARGDDSTSRARFRASFRARKCACGRPSAGAAPAEGCRPPGRSSRAAVPTAVSSGSSQPPILRSVRALSLRANAPTRLSCGLWGAKMERVSEDLQLSVIVEGRRPLALEPQPLEKLDFLRGHRAAERRILKEFLEPGLFADRLFDFPLDKLESLRLPWDDAVVEDNLQTERRKVDVPGFNQRIQERDAVLSGHVEDVRIEELEHDDPHLLIAAAT